MNSIDRISWFILFSAGLIFLTVIFHNCDEYTDHEVVLKVVFHDAQYKEIDTTFDRVYGLGNSMNINKTSYGNDDSFYYLPLSLHSDSSKFVFEKNGLKEFLGIAYKTELKYLSESEGMQVRYTDVAVLPTTTFKNVEINLYNCWIESSDECFTVKIYLY